MISKNQILKVIKILFIIYFVISFGIYTKNAYIAQNIIVEEMGLKTFIYNLVIIFYLGLYDFFIKNHMLNFILLILFSGITLANKSLGTKKERVKKDIKYFREILEKYTPAEISFLSDFESDYYLDIMATILDLKCKKKIDIVNQEIIIINYGDGGLNYNEKYVFNKLLNKDISSLYKEDDQFRYIVIKDLISRKDLIGINANKKGQTKIAMSFIIVFVVVMFGGFTMLFNIQNSISLPSEVFNKVGLAWWLSGGLIIAISYVFTIIYANVGKDIDVSRTKSGKSVTKKIYALENFLEDFSALDEKKLKQINLWEEYLVYSLLFKQNKVLYDEMSNIKTIK